MANTSVVFNPATGTWGAAVLIHDFTSRDAAEAWVRAASALLAACEEAHALLCQLVVPQQQGGVGGTLESDPSGASVWLAAPHGKTRETMQLRLEYDGPVVTCAAAYDGAGALLIELSNPTALQIRFLHWGCAAPALLAACEAARAFVDPSLPGATRMYAQLDAAIAAAKEESS